MEKSPDEVLNLPKYTSADIFGDASDEDEAEHALAEETGTDGKKRKLVERVRLTEQQKIEIAATFCAWPQKDAHLDPR